MLLEEIFNIEPFFWTILLRCAVASLCGVFIGVERAYRAKPAGIRTHMLISLGSCLFMGVSLAVAAEARKLGYTTSDPARIAAQVVTGIGFLGAGAIIQNRGLVRGMTSAATIWCMAAIGMAAGAGMLITALVCSVAMILILRTFDFLEDKIQLRRFRIMSIDVTIKKEARVPEVRKLLRAMQISLSHEQVKQILGEVHYHASMLLRGDLEEKIEKRLKNMKGVKDIVILVPGDMREG